MKAIHAGAWSPVTTKHASPRHAKRTGYAIHASRTRKHPFRRAFGILLTLVVAAVIAVSGYFAFQGYRMYEDAAGALSLDAMAETIRTSDGFTPLEDMPVFYTEAVITVEDHRFRMHPGFDIIATSRALFNDIRAGAFVEGGSTITQQLAKNQFFTQDKTITRKFAEVFMAFDIERHFTKDQILELYLNSIYFGSGYYGIGQAALGYLGKTPADMTDAECALMAGIPNAPSAYDPTVNPGLAQQRRQQVIDKMVEHKVISPDQARQIAAA